MAIKKILVIDDSSGMRRIIVNMLRKEGFNELIEGIHGLDGQEKLKQEANIDLILCDWNMPEMDGLQFLKWVKSQDEFKKIPFIMVTSENEKSKIVEAIKAGADNYVSKPFNPDTILEKIATFD